MNTISIIDTVIENKIFELLKIMSNYRDDIHIKSTILDPNERYYDDVTGNYYNVSTDVYHIAANSELTSGGECKFIEYDYTTADSSINKEYIKTWLTDNWNQIKDKDKLEIERLNTLVEAERIEELMDLMELEDM